MIENYSLLDARYSILAVIPHSLRNPYDIRNTTYERRATNLPQRALVTVARYGGGLRRA
jgi:hypothetical protein